MDRIALKHILSDLVEIQDMLARSEEEDVDQRDCDRALVKALRLIDMDLRRFVGLESVWNSLRPRPRTRRWHIRQPKAHEELNEEILISRLSRALSLEDWPETKVERTLQSMLQSINEEFHSPLGEGVAVHIARPQMARVSARATEAYERLHYETSTHAVTEPTRQGAKGILNTSKASLAAAVIVVGILSDTPSAISNAGKIWDHIHPTISDDSHSQTSKTAKAIDTSGPLGDRRELPLSTWPHPSEQENGPHLGPRYLGK